MDPDNVPPTNEKKPNQSTENAKKGVIMNSINVQLTDTEHVCTLSEYVAEKKKEMQTTSEKRGDMGRLRRFIDGKVPDKDKAFYHFFTFKSSKKSDILEIIKTYKTFFEEMSTEFPPMTGEEQIKCQDLRTKIEKIKKKMLHVYASAKNAVDETSSKVIYEMHQSFIEEYEKLNWMVEAADNAALSKMLVTVQARWEEAIERLTTLSLEYEKVSKNYADINQKYTDISQKYDELKVSQDAMLATNQRLEAKVDEVMELLRRFIP